MKKLFGGIIRFIKNIFARLSYNKIKDIPALPVQHKAAQTLMTPGMIDYMRRHLGLKKSGLRFAGQPAWLKAEMLDKASAKRVMRANKRRAT